MNYDKVILTIEGNGPKGAGNLGKAFTEVLGPPSESWNLWYRIDIEQHVTEQGHGKDEN